jgi:hypothetical protein
MRFDSKAIDAMTPKELAYGALVTRSPRHRMAMVAELLARLAAHDVTPMLKQLPLQEKETA